MFDSLMGWINDIKSLFVNQPKLPPPDPAKALNPRCPWYYFYKEHKMGQSPVKSGTEYIGHQDRGKIILDYRRHYFFDKLGNHQPRGGWEECGFDYRFFLVKEEEEVSLVEVIEGTKPKIQHKIKIKRFHRIKREEAIMFLFEGR